MRDRIQDLVRRVLALALAGDIAAAKAIIDHASASTK
jgi:hypothetical protein